MLRNVTGCVSLLVAALIVGVTSASASTTNYSYQKSQGTYTEITGGTTVHTGTADDVSTSIPIGFSFRFANADYTSVFVGTNGSLTFDAGYTGYNALSDGAGYTGAIAPFSNDLILVNGVSSVSYVQTGTAPNRVLTVQWRNVARWISGGASQDRLNFQVRLSEGSNQVDIVYGSMNVVNYVGAEIGLRGLDDSDVNCLSVDYDRNTPTTPHWSSTAVPSFFEKNWAPASGTTYSWVRRVGPNIANLNNDAAVIAVVNPSAKFNANTSQQVQIRVKNFGANNLDSVVINWRVNGVTQTPVRYYPQPALAPNGEATITIGNVNLGALSFNTITAATLAPNGVADANPSNDEVSAYLAPRVAGTLNLAQTGSAGTFGTARDVIRHLNVAGINGNVTVNVWPGTYAEQLPFEAINGATGANKITFRKQNPASDVVFTHTVQNYGSNYTELEEGYIVGLVDADNLTFDGIKFDVDDASGAQWTAHVYGSVDNVTFRNVTFQGVASNIGLNGYAISNFGVMSNLLVEGCTFEHVNGAYVDNSPIGNGLVFRGNTLTDVNAIGIQSYGSGLLIENNKITMSTGGTTGQQIAIANVGSGGTIRANIISMAVISGQVGLGILNDPTNTSLVNVVNNMVAITGDGRAFGIYFAGNNDYRANVYHNSVNLTVSQVVSTPLYVAADRVTYPNAGIRSLNNIFHNFGMGTGAGPAVVVANNSATPFTATNHPLNVADFNDLMTTGANIGFFDNAAVVRNAGPNPLASWRTATTRENNSVSVAVNFIGGADLHLLQIQGELWGSNTILPAVPTDIDGDVRHKPYMGADEVSPSIRFVQQPESRYACPGESFTLIAIADVTPGATVTYQWQKDGIDLVGKTSAILAFNNVGYNASGVYTVVVKASDGTTTVSAVSEEAGLIVVRETQITVQPKSQPVVLGGRVTLEVAAEAIGSPANFVPTYQWKKRFWNPTAVAYQDTVINDDSRISGTRSSMLTIRDVKDADTMDTYVVEVTGYCGTTTSKVARLFVPTVFASTATPTPCVGGNIVLECVVMPDAQLGYQWYRNNVAIFGATSKTLTITDANAANDGEYTCVATFLATGTEVISNAIAITVGSAPAITAQPTPVTVCEGAPINISTTATGTNVAYQWMKGTTAIPGATTATYTVAAATTDNAGSYTVIVTNACGTVTSDAVDVTVHTAPAITTQPTSQAVIEGAELSFTVVVTGSDTLKYQWYHDDVAIPGATGATYTVAAAVGADTGSYHVVVTNGCGSVTSDKAQGSVTVGVAGEVAQDGYVLGMASPNPTMGETSFSYTLPSTQHVRIVLTDVLGRELAQFVNGMVDAGQHRIEFNATQLNLVPGLYLYTISAQRFNASQQVVIVK
ncbi:MAG: hypothetical protein BGO89_05330 [Candidatus Kapaibacterium thiocyanatum]|uniref:Ig-like domain-containing protein n=1 Tax=Candidatus Kapaibacterium thiocyanatum TaxID=1895771 RepID=A0A1M3L1B1_9BACT|nr:MAG: hypothetical protein BGO89_05330 ['Candidatus Kapabacteria' thiocyanatum]